MVDPTAGPHGTLVVATESNDIYGFDAADGHQLWTRNLGVPWNSSDIGCSDVGQTVGITSTPAIDTTTHTAYMTSKTYDSNGAAIYKVRAIDLADGSDKSSFANGVTIAGAASNAPTKGFDAKNLLQRPGPLMMSNGFLYAAFGGLCDTAPYRGWVVGVNKSNGAVATRWTDEAGLLDPNPPETGRPGGGIWQSGGHLVEDNGDIVAVSGNGDMPSAPTAGSAAPSTLALGESVIRLRPAPITGVLQAVDFWTPCNAQDLADRDLDLGSGAPLVLPTPQFPANLLLVVGKAAPLYLLHRDNLGGFQQGGAGSCSDNSGSAGDNIVSSFSPGGAFGPWATPSVWPGDGGLIYLPYQAYLSSPKVLAYRVSGGGTPTLSIAGQSNDDPYGFGSSSAIVTSTGTSSGSALMWIVRLPGGDGVGAELRAYDPVPVNGNLTLRGRWSIGQGTKFNTPTVHNGRMYVGSQDGFVHAFGAVPPSTAAAQSPPPPRRATTTEVPDKGQ
ncbi:MAG TPA: hypothetical protein VGO28_04130 [Acidimicrobiia bacterium]